MSTVVDPFLSQIYDGSTSPKEFERNFKLQAAVHGWDAKQLALIEVFLTGDAKGHYNDLEN
jgi:hypothetical protein